MPPRLARRAALGSEFSGPNKDEAWWQSDSEGEQSDQQPGLTGGGCGEEDPETMLYDPEMDEKDAKWADKTRSGRVSDAILSCPGCFTTLTVDCQQHSKHHNQFRAMLVMNCSVDKAREMQSVTQPSAGKKKERSKAKQMPGVVSEGVQEQQQPAGSVERFYPVSCAACSTEVGVVDQEDVYHFFHVFPSNA